MRSLVSIHHRNIRLIGIVLHKTRNNISSHIMNELFEQRNILCTLRSQTDFTTGPISTVNAVTLGMSICHIFGTNHSEVLWQIERVPILAMDPFFCVF